MKILANKLCLLTVMLLIAAPALASGGEGHGVDWKLMGFKFFNFIIFFGGLAYLLRKGVGEFFTNRKSTIRDSLELAESSVKEAKEKLDIIEKKMANLDGELEDIHKQAKEDLVTETENIQAQAKTDAARILAQAAAECENMKREALLSLKAQLADLAVKDAEGIIKDTMSNDERNHLFSDFTAKLGARS